MPYLRSSDFIRVDLRLKIFLRGFRRRLFLIEVKEILNREGAK